MRVVDCHVHVSVEKEVDVAETLKRMDANGIDRLLLMSPMERVSLDKTRQALLKTKKLFDAAPERLSGLAWLNPAVEGTIDLAEEAIADMGFVGFKSIPDHWYPYEERIQPFWAKLNELKASVLFHTGIVYAFEDDSRYCQPVYLETLYHYPDVRFVMGHISWPWCEECIAVMGRMRCAGKDSKNGVYQSYIDLTPGTPKHIRKQTISNTVDFLGSVDHLMFGTDASVPSDLPWQAEHVERDLGIFDELGLTEEQKQRIMAGTADDVFPPKA